jgi:hypothetical protein
LEAVELAVIVKVDCVINVLSFSNYIFTEMEDKNLFPNPEYEKIGWGLGEGLPDKIW